MILVTAGVIHNNEGYILITKRKEGKHLAGYWEFPGGKIEANETPEQCLQREIQEELNIQIKVTKFIADSVYHYKDKSICLKGYYAQYNSGDIVLHDHDEFRWVTLTALSDYKFARQIFQ